MSDRSENEEVIARLVWSEEEKNYEVEWNHTNERTKDIFKEGHRREALRAGDDGIADLTFFRMLLIEMSEISSHGHTLH